MPGLTEVDAILRSDLTAFVHKVFTTVSSNDTFKPNWHIEAITYELMRGSHVRVLIDPSATKAEALQLLELIRDTIETDDDYEGRMKEVVF